MTRDRKRNLLVLQWRHLPGRIFHEQNGEKNCYKISYLSLSDGGIHLGINYSVSNETK